ncbi:MAG: hypothetical protein LUD17_12320 [Bacteroidales bacterium]|nr:hypothetical protein [Bacteroidales bacterium]
MRTIDILRLTLHPYGGGSVTMLYPAEELEPGLLLLKARRCPDDGFWPEIEVVDIDDFSLTLKIALLTPEEFEPFTVTLDEPFTLGCPGSGDMIFTLIEDYEEDDSRWDAYS